MTNYTCTYLAVTENDRSDCSDLRFVFTRKYDGSSTDTLNFGSTRQPHNSTDLGSSDKNSTTCIEHLLFV